ncbi:MFS transporter [Nibricoccus sp. IMCC34717]|uniref:MFS transporter n=1 Tax=Nibricoccus sp. IMCC34717 TaxID=3034021 RepID=UPI00384AE89A
MQPLSVREKLGFSLGEVAGSGFWQITLIFLGAFYTDTVGLSALAVANMMLFVRIFDALNDPLMGMIADRTRTRWGRYRPWLLWMILPFCAFVVAAFYLPPGLGQTGRLVYSYFTYTTVMVIYTALMIPYSALSGVMTNVAADRTSLNTWRFFIAFTIAFFLKLLLKPSVAFFGQGNDALGFRITLSLYIVLALVGMLCAFWTTRERVTPQVETQSSVLTDLRDLMRNGPWVTLLAVSIVLWFFFGVRSTVQVYYFKYYLGNDAAVSPFLATGALCTLVGVFATGWLTKHFEKKVLFVVCMALNAVGLLGFYLVKPGDWALLYGLQIFQTFVGGPFMPLIWSMMADAADYSEFKTGRRATGLVFSASTMAQKMGGAFGGSAALYVMSFYGYVANQAQNEAVLSGFRQMMSVYLFFGYMLCAVILLFYPLGASALQSMQAELARRRAPAPTG